MDGYICLSVSVLTLTVIVLLENSISFPSLSTATTYQTTKGTERTRITRDLQTTITSRPFPAKPHDQNKNVNHHDDTWIAVSSSLIGSLVTLILIGCFLCFRSRKRLKVKFPKRIQRNLFSRTDEEMTTASEMDCKRYDNPCCYNQRLISESKDCKDCLPGSFRWNCNHTCLSGFYGQLCQSTCECPAFNCPHVTGCTTENSSNWSENTTDEKHQTSNFPDWLDKTEEWQTTKTSNLKLFTVFNWSNKTTDMEAMITSSLYPAGRQDQNVKQHDVTWLAVSCSLIGSLATLFLIGCFMYFRSRRTLQKKAPKGIKRILFSRLEPDRNIQHHPQEGQLEHSTLIPTQQCQGDDPYAEIRYSLMGGECAEAAININNKGNTMSKEPKCVARNTNMYGQCSFETEYDHINLKMNSSLPPSLQKEGRSVIGDLQEYADLPDEGRLQQEFPNHDGSSKSLTLPLNLKRVSEHNELKPRFYSLCHDVSTNMLKVDQDKTGTEKDCVKQVYPEGLQTESDPEVKEEDRPYSCVHSLLNDDLNPEEKSSTAGVSITLSSVKEDSSPSIDRPYSYVKNL